jgi:hypothetical protein
VWTLPRDLAVSGVVAQHSAISSACGRYRRLLPAATIDPEIYCSERMFDNTYDITVTSQIRNRIDHTKGTTMTDPNTLIPLATVAAEIGSDADVLAARLGDAVTPDDIGIRCIPADIARDQIARHRAAVQADRDQQRAQRDAAKRRPFALRQRIRAIGRQQERFAGAALPATAVMMADDIEDRLEASGHRMDELMSGDSVYHPIGEKG